ncbi:MAG: DUF4267 domain-containing protein [Hyphomicrobiaceae bacterium]
MTGTNPVPGKHRHLVWLSLAVGVLLAVIGIRFMIVPRTAANNFGLARDTTGYELHYMVGLRDMWLGGLAAVLALIREWRALAWWFALGTGVCLADALIAAASSGKAAAIAFHAGSALLCGGMAAALFKRFGARP